MIADRSRTTAATTVLHRERLWPGIWVWAMGLGLLAALSIAYATALGDPAGWLVAAAGGSLLVLAIARMAATVEVRSDGLRAGRATLLWSAAGRALALDADQARRARGPEGDPSAYLVLRPGVGPGALVVEVTDQTDPHRTWLVASRDPHRLARAIADARGTLTP